MRRKSRRRGFLNSLINAVNGLRFAVYSQINMMIHLTVAVLVLACAFYFKISVLEWLTLIISIFFVLIAEAFNTAVEISIDLVTRKEKVRAKLAKDVAAGAVLLSAINAVVVGYLLFWSRFVNLLR